MEIKTKQIIDPTCAFQCSSAWFVIPFGKQPLVDTNEWLKILFPELCLSNQEVGRLPLEEPEVPKHKVLWLESRAGN